MSAHKAKKNRARLPLTAGLVVMLATGGGIALLIWAKLRLVTGVPRTVYAQPPKDESVESAPGVAAPDTQADARDPD